MQTRKISVVGSLLILFGLLFCGSLAAAEVSFSFQEEEGGVAVELRSDSEIFARAVLTKEAVASWDTNRIALADGGELVFSCLTSGLIAIDFRPGNSGSEASTLERFSPLEFSLAGLGTVGDNAESDRIKALGTKGLTAVDGHAGSYMFLAIADCTDRHGVVAVWDRSERGSGVLFSSKRADGTPMLRPQIDYGRLRIAPGAQEPKAERLFLGAFRDCRVGLETAVDEIARSHGIELKRCMSGYCTWYSDRFGGACDQEHLPLLAESIVKNFANYGFDFIQIDDLWQAGANIEGPAKNFTEIRADGPYSRGLAPVTEQLKKMNLTTGLWFLPFAGMSSDPWYADKQDYFVTSAIDYPAAGEPNMRLYPSIKQKKGAPYETFWGGTSLDMTNPKVRDYLTDIVHRMKNDWGMRYFKVDGLWTGMACEQLYINNEYIPDDLGQQNFLDANATNVEAYRLGLTTLREAAGEELFILGCNVSQNMRVLSASIGAMDAMRIGPDNGASWDSMKLGPWHGSNRYFLNGRVWWNDPDPVYVRASVPLNQATALVSWVALTGQLLAVSDWIPDLPAERIELVRRVLPNHQKKTVRPVDFFERDFPEVWLLTDQESGPRREVVGLFNWNTEGEKKFSLTPEYLGLAQQDESGNPVEKYVTFDFWNNCLVEPFETLDVTVPGASCAILSVRAVSDFPVLLGTSRHMAAGIVEVEKESWNSETKTLQLVVTPVPGEPMELRIYDPVAGQLRRETVTSDTPGPVTVEYRF